MKAEDIKIEVRLVEVLRAPRISAQEHMCEKYGVNEWCLNEGLTDDESTIEISLEDAERYGIVERE